MSRREDPMLIVKIKVRDVMNSPIITATPDEGIDNVAKKMRGHKVGSVVVVGRGGEDNPVGIVTDGDIIQKVVAENKVPSSVRVREVMSSPVENIDAEDDIINAARLMRRKGIKRLVVYYKGKAAGIISMSDILNVIPEVLDVLSEKARMISGDVSRRRRLISGYCDNCGQWSDYLAEIDGRFLCEECRSS